MSHGLAAHFSLFDYISSMRHSAYTFRGYRVTIQTEKVSRNRWQGRATIESISPTDPIPTREIRLDFEFGTEGEAYREIKKLAESQISDLF